MNRSILLGAALVAASLSPSTVHADLPDGLVFDDAFAFYQAEARGTMSNNRPTNGYYVSAWARILGQNVAPDSGFRFVYKQGRRTLGTITCTGHRAWRTQNMGNSPADTFVVANCNDTEDLFSATGAITVEVIFIDDNTDQEHAVATHEIDVRELRQESHTGQARTSDYTVNLHGFGAVAYLDQVARGQQYALGGMNGLASSGANAPESQVNLIISRSSGNNPDRTYSLRCSVGGERIEFGYARLASGSVSERRSNATQVLRGGPSTQQEHINWQTDRYRLPIAWGDNTNGARLEDHPGRWECSLRDDDRRVIRDFAFSVADGRIQPHPEEAGLNFIDGMHLADVTVAGENDADERTDPAVARTEAFWGRGFQTPEGQAMGRRVAAIGEAYPSSARARRGRRR